MFTSLPDGQIRLDQPLYHAVWLDDGIEFQVSVPNGFVSDGASIPSYLWPVPGPPIGNRHLIPAIIHDWTNLTSYYNAHKAFRDANTDDAGVDDDNATAAPSAGGGPVIPPPPGP